MQTCLDRKISLFLKKIAHIAIFCSKYSFWSIADISRLKISPLKKKKNRLIQDLGQNSRQNFQKFFVSLLTHPLRDENSVWTCPQCPDRMGLKISLFSKNFCLIQDFAQNCLFGLLLTWSRLKISLFLKISTLPKILLKIVIMWTCPDWKFHSFQRLLPNLRFYKILPVWSKILHKIIILVHRWNFSQILFTRSQILIKIIVILVHCGHVQRGKFHFSRKKLFFAKTFTQSKILIKFFILVHCRHFSQIFFTRSQILLEIVILVQCGHVQVENFILSKTFAWSKILQKNCHFCPRFCTKIVIMSTADCQD